MIFFHENSKDLNIPYAYWSMLSILIDFQVAFLKILSYNRQINDQYYVYFAIINYIYIYVLKMLYIRG